jgi:hypothetical protein
MAFLKGCGQMLPKANYFSISPCGEVEKSPFAEGLGHLNYLQPLASLPSPHAVETTR